MGFIADAFTGKKQAKAATQAAQTQSDASKYAADLSQKQYEQTRKDQMPWLDAGRGALAGLNQMLADNREDNPLNITANGGSGVYQDKWGSRLEDAYTDGRLTGGLDPENFSADPSYQFRKKEGMDGIQSSAAASGGLLSGAALKALTGYNSDLASQEYNNAWQRDQAEKEREWGVLSGGRTQDYNIFQGENTRKFNQLASVAGTGLTTASNLGSLGAANAQSVGNGTINSANAQANGIVGAANAKSNGFRNLIGLGTGLLGLI